MKIDIYACKFGSGHMGAAMEVQSFLKENNINSNVYDILEAIYPFASDYIYKTHNFLLQNKKFFIRKRDIKKFDYNTDFYEKVFSLKKNFFEYLDGSKLPDIFIATYSWASFLISEYIEERNLDIPLITYITDYTFHDLWINKSTSLYLVMSKYTKEILMSYGISPEKIVIFGEGLCAGRPSGNNTNILISGGGLGLLPQNEEFYKDLEKLKRYNFRIVFGKNKSLYKKVLKLDLKNVECYQYVNGMEELFKWADVFVTKPGGMSIYDSLKYQLPIVYFTPFLPQEIKNMNFIKSEDIGVELKNQDLRILESLLRNKEELVRIKSNLRSVQSNFAPNQLINWIENVSN